MGKGRTERVQEVPLLQLPLHNKSGRGSGNMQLRAVGQWYMREREREMLARAGGWGATGRGSGEESSEDPNMWMGECTAVQRWAICWALRLDRRGEVSTALLLSAHSHPLSLYTLHCLLCSHHPAFISCLLMLSYGSSYIILLCCLVTAVFISLVWILT